MTNDREVCDLCDGEEKLLWEWWTPNEADSVAEALTTGKAWFEDNGWYVCDPCHQLVLNESWEALAQRAIENIGQKLFCEFDEKERLRVIDPRPHILNTHAAFRRCRTFYAPIGENPLTRED